MARPFDLGDHVKIGEEGGIVKKMNLISTTVFGFDNRMLVVPNRTHWGSTIVNFTSARVRRVDVTVNFSYSADVDEVESLLTDLMASDERVLNKPAPFVAFGDMQDSSVSMTARMWVKTDDYWPVLMDFKKSVMKRFADSGIQIPFPQIDVHLPDSPKGAS